ncbi:hypothetical protein [Nocardioides flavescens]|uniref:Uncharacterized protein n=1 Tax=Nocardioides flavescens TaxID=2691959 RepID=A0A6L7EMU3_9ACTN|nr:hypothetical protein [Nocardioides flavescens]MXG88653.1 hypothetical protein [Nocardioides flavescens]
MVDVLAPLASLTSVTAFLFSITLEMRDRARRERATRVRPQPLRRTRGSTWLKALALAGLAASVVLRIA